MDHPNEISAHLAVLQYIPGQLIHPSEWEEANTRGESNVYNVELQYLLKRWFPEPDNALLKAIDEKRTIYGSLMDMNQPSAWMILINDMSNKPQAIHDHEYTF